LIGVVVGTVAAGLMSDTRNFLTSLLNGTWNAGETLLAAWLVERWFGESFTFRDLRHFIPQPLRHFGMCGVNGSFRVGSEWWWSRR
jgi:hypothetical protein